jgi:hypothetical protein
MLSRIGRTRTGGAEGQSAGGEAISGDGVVREFVTNLVAYGLVYSPPFWLRCDSLIVNRISPPLSLSAARADGGPSAAPQPSGRDVERETRKHVLAEATLVGIYER